MIFSKLAVSQLYPFILCLHSIYEHVTLYHLFICSFVCLLFVPPYQKVYPLRAGSLHLFTTLPPVSRIASGS